MMEFNSNLVTQALQSLMDTPETDPFYVSELRIDRREAMRFSSDLSTQCSQCREWAIWVARKSADSLLDGTLHQNTVYEGEASECTSISQRQKSSFKMSYVAPNSSESRKVSTNTTSRKQIKPKKGKKNKKKKKKTETTSRPHSLDEVPDDEGYGMEYTEEDIMDVIKGELVLKKKPSAEEYFREMEEVVNQAFFGQDKKSKAEVGNDQDHSCLPAQLMTDKPTRQPLVDGEVLSYIIDKTTQWINIYPMASSLLQVYLDPSPHALPLEGVSDRFEDEVCLHLLTECKLSRNSISLKNEMIPMLLHICPCPHECLYESHPDEMPSPSELEREKEALNEQIDGIRQIYEQELKNQLEDSWVGTRTYLRELKECEGRRKELVGRKANELQEDFMKLHKVMLRGFSEVWPEIVERCKQAAKKKKVSNMDAMLSKLDEEFNTYMDNFVRVNALFLSLVVEELIEEVSDEFKFLKEASMRLLNFSPKLFQKTGKSHTLFEEATGLTRKKVTEILTDVSNLVEVEISNLRDRTRYDHADLIVATRVIKDEWKEEKNRTWAGRMETAQSKVFCDTLAKMEAQTTLSRAGYISEVMSVFRENLVAICSIACFKVVIKEGELMVTIVTEALIEAFEEKIQAVDYRRENLTEQFRMGVTIGRVEFGRHLARLFIKEAIQLYQEKVSLKRQKTLFHEDFVETKGKQLKGKKEEHKSKGKDSRDKEKETNTNVSLAEHPKEATVSPEIFLSSSDVKEPHIEDNLYQCPAPLSPTNTSKQTESAKQTPLMPCGHEESSGTKVNPNVPLTVKGNSSRPQTDVAPKVTKKTPVPAPEISLPKNSMIKRIPKKRPGVQNDELSSKQEAPKLKVLSDKLVTSTAVEEPKESSIMNERNSVKEKEKLQVAENDIEVKIGSPSNSTSSIAPNQTEVASETIMATTEEPAVSVQSPTTNTQKVPPLSSLNQSQLITLVVTLENEKKQLLTHIDLMEKHYMAILEGVYSKQDVMKLKASFETELRRVTSVYEKQLSDAHRYILTLEQQQASLMDRPVPQIASLSIPSTSSSLSHHEIYQTSAIFSPPFSTADPAPVNYESAFDTTSPRSRPPGFDSVDSDRQFH
jgi:hypothetical protein